MNWLVQNWIWILAALAFIVMMSRHGFGHGAHGGSGHGGLGHGGQPEAGPAPAGSSGAPVGAAGAAIDPVSGNPVRTDKALSSVHRGRVFYFESAETRQRFEAEPDRYAASASGDPVPGNPEPYRRRGGC